MFRWSASPLLPLVMRRGGVRRLITYAIDAVGYNADCLDSRGLWRRRGTSDSPYNDRHDYGPPVRIARTPRRCDGGRPSADASPLVSR